MTTIRKEFRRKVEERRALVIPGAFNAMSARIIADQGFEAVFLTGAGLTNMYYGMPDLGFMGLRDVAEHTARIRDVVDIPLFVDIDTGFGNAINVIYAIEQYERAGVAAVVIEDKTFPKVTSLVADGRQELLRTEEFQGKIRAAIATRRDPDLLVIARTEALIAGLGEEEALKRAAAYEAAGADMILIHSKQKTPDEIEAFVRAWDGKAPIALVPTAYPQMTVARVRELKKIGLLIWGNHAIRASVGAMRATFAQIRKDGGIHGVESRIATVDDVFELQGMSAVKENEKRFLR